MTGAIVEPTKVEVRTISFEGIMSDHDVEIGTGGLSRTSRWRLEREGKFPRRVQLSPGRVGWIGSEILNWIKSRPRVGEEVK